MEYRIHFHDDGTELADVDLIPTAATAKRIDFEMDVAHFTAYVNKPTRRRRRGGTGPRIIERLLDPEADRPILKKLMQTVAPIALQFLTTQLPSWLSSVDLGKAFETPSDLDGE